MLLAMPLFKQPSTLQKVTAPKGVQSTYEACVAAWPEEACYLCLWMTVSFPAFHSNRRRIDRQILPGTANGEKHAIQLAFTQ